MLFLTSCAGCDEPGETLCRRCRFSLVATSALTTASGVRAAMPFDGVARQTVLSLKFHNRRGVAKQLAALMIRRLRPAGVDIVTWAPTSGARAGRRGFDQAELLARELARQLGVPCRRLLYRVHGTSQAGRSRVERLHGPAFRARAPRPALRVLLVDDVVTTGATLHAAAAALTAAGVANVQCVAAAATTAGRVGRGAGDLRSTSSTPPPGVAHLGLAS